MNNSKDALTIAVSTALDQMGVAKAIAQECGGLAINNTSILKLIGQCEELWAGIDMMVQDIPDADFVTDSPPPKSKPKSCTVFECCFRALFSRSPIVSNPQLVTKSWLWKINEKDYGPVFSAHNWLVKKLSQGPAFASDIKKQSAEAGHAWITIKRLKKALGITHRKEGILRGKTMWMMPNDAPLPKAAVVGAGEEELKF